VLLLIDNYDSFTYNLVQYFAVLGEEVVVRRNDAIDVSGALALRPDRIVLSPGPGTPDDAGVSIGLVAAGARIPILGVCLGHQSIGQAFGARIVRAERVMHGKFSRVRHDGRGVFTGLPQGFAVGRYHSLVMAPESLPAVLEATAWADDGSGTPADIMGVRHRTEPIEGVQFHPESILTEHGLELLRRFVARR
jgi:anthranilate synthase component 2